MNIKIQPCSLSGKISAIPSKSYAHRILICDFLAGNQIRTQFGGFASNDISVTADCLNKLKNGQTTLDCGESGSTLRFMILLCASIGGQFEFVGHGRLMQRPNEQLFSVLREHGVSVSQDKSIKISGKLTAGEYYVSGNVSSQYVSGLIMALSTVEGKSTIILTTPLGSKPYVDITMEIVNGYGGRACEISGGYQIDGVKRLSGNLYPEGDWSNSAFFLTLGAIGDRITVDGLNLNSAQGDKKILEILRLAGAKVVAENQSVWVVKDKLNPFTVSLDDCPDLVPITAVLASFCDGKSILNDIERLKVKESDRIESIIAMLNAFGIKAQSDGKSMTVFGSQPTAGEINSFNDHRIVMASAVLASMASGQSVITDAQAVNKSYPTFFDDFCKLGGKANEF